MFLRNFTSDIACAALVLSSRQFKVGSYVIVVVEEMLVGVRVIVVLMIVRAGGDGDDGGDDDGGDDGGDQGGSDGDKDGGGGELHKL